MMCDFPASAEVEKFKQPLDIASRPKAYCTNSAGLLHAGWAQLLVCLHVGTKLKLTISLEIELSSSDNGSEAQGPGHAAC